MARYGNLFDYIISINSLHLFRRTQSNRPSALAWEKYNRAVKTRLAHIPIPLNHVRSGGMLQNGQLCFRPLIYLENSVQMICAIHS